MDEPRFHPLDYVSVLRRRKWWFIAPFAACVIVGALLAAFLPREYMSEAEIGIADPTLSPELLRGVQSLDARERQRAVQQLLSRTVLERVVREERLSPNRPVEEAAAALRARVEENISVPPPLAKSGGTKEGIESFRLGYVADSPERAQRIANRVATVFVEENSKTKTQRAENTSEVLAQQLRDSEEKLAQLQDQLTKKKVAYMGRLPTQMDTNAQTLNGLRQQLESLSTQIAGESQRLSQIESTLEMMQQGAGSSALTSAGVDAIRGSQSRVTALQRELTGARALGYTDKHPEIVRIKSEIAEAERELAAAGQAPANREELLSADPLFRQKLDERNLLRIRLTQLRRAETQARAQIADYQRRVESAPMVEQELAPLTQSYDLERARHADLATKYQNAVIAEDLARKQGGERFVVLNPAYLPGRPVKPDILMVLLVSVGLGFALGTIAVVGREFLDRSVHDVRALQTEFEVPVLGEIPRIHGAV